MADAPVHTEAQTVEAPIPAHIADAIRRVGAYFDPDVRSEFLGYYTELLTARPPSTAKVVRDLAYGPDARHRLDVHVPSGTGGAPRPVIVFFHGGGFIEGHKNLAGDAIFGNVANTFTEAGFVAVNATYRLAPGAQWPEGARDVARAARWVAVHIGAHEGDRDRVFLMGHSAGATHVAASVFHRDLRDDEAPCAGVVLVSGSYDVEERDQPANITAYYGEDAAAYAGKATLRNLADIDLPALVVTAEYDPPRFVEHAAAFVAALRLQTRIRPRVMRIKGHSHISEIYHIGTGDEALAPHIAAFCHAPGG